MGAKLAYTYNILFAGPQYDTGTSTDISAVMGVYAKGMLEAWVGYIFSAKDAVSKGTGARVGLSVAISKVFHLGAEYVDRTFFEYRGESNGIPIYDGRSKSYKVILSCPITFW